MFDSEEEQSSFSKLKFVVGNHYKRVVVKKLRVTRHNHHHHHRRRLRHQQQEHHHEQQEQQPTTVKVIHRFTLFIDVVDLTEDRSILKNVEVEWHPRFRLGKESFDNQFNYKNRRRIFEVTHHATSLKNVVRGITLCGIQGRHQTINYRLRCHDHVGPIQVFKDFVRVVQNRQISAITSVRIRRRNDNDDNDDDDDNSQASKRLRLVDDNEGPSAIFHDDDDNYDGAFDRPRLVDFSIPEVPHQVEFSIPERRQFGFSGFMAMASRRDDDDDDEEEEEEEDDDDEDDDSSIRDDASQGIQELYCFTAIARTDNDAQADDSSYTIQSGLESFPVPNTFHAMDIPMTPEFIFFTQDEEDRKNLLNDDFSIDFDVDRIHSLQELADSMVEQSTETKPSHHQQQQHHHHHQQQRQLDFSNSLQRAMEFQKIDENRDPPEKVSSALDRLLQTVELPRLLFRRDIRNKDTFPFSATRALNAILWKLNMPRGKRLIEYQNNLERYFDEREKEITTNMRGGGGDAGFGIEVLRVDNTSLPGEVSIYSSRGRKLTRPRGGEGWPDSRPQAIKLASVERDELWEHFGALDIWSVDELDKYIETMAKTPGNIHDKFAILLVGVEANVLTL